MLEGNPHSPDSFFSKKPQMAEARGQMIKMTIILDFFQAETPELAEIITIII